MSARNQQLDTVFQVVTPENVAFEYRVAGPFRRLPAYLLDLSIRWAFVVGLLFVSVFAFALPLTGGLAIAMWLVAMFVTVFFYGGLFETYWNGQTPGKWLMGIRVVSVDGSPITGLQAVLRNLLRFVDSFPLAPISLIFEDFPPVFFVMTYQVGIFSAMLSPRYQRVGDIVCKTVVIVEEKSIIYGVARVEEPEVVRLAASLPVGFEVARSLGQALSHYVERRRYFSPGRRADIARHLGEPLRQRFNLPPGTSHDLIVCALYYRTFIGEQAALERQDVLRNPFAQPASNVAGLFSGLPGVPEPVYETPEIVTADRK